MEHQRERPWNFSVSLGDGKAMWSLPVLFLLFLAFKMALAYSSDIKKSILFKGLIFPGLFLFIILVDIECVGGGREGEDRGG